MILKLDNKILAVAKEIHSVFQASYLVEAKLLKAVDFPPLKRAVSQFLNSTTDFYAYYLNNNIAGVIEIDNSKIRDNFQESKNSNIDIIIKLIKVIIIAKTSLNIA